MAGTEQRRRQQALLWLSHELGNPLRSLAILGEGNASTNVSPGAFLVKASGCNLATLTKRDVVHCRAAPLLALLDAKNCSDEKVKDTLMASRVDSHAKQPSVEALFHAYFLSLSTVEFVGHTHAPHVNRLLCSPRASEFAVKRLFPDEVVYCDIESVWVPYVDPGLQLARAIRTRTAAFIKKHG